MNTLKQLLSQFVASLTKPQLYLTILDQKGRSTLLYFYLAAFVLALFSAGWIYFGFTPKFVQNLGTVRSELVDTIPGNYQIHSDGQQVTVTTLGENNTQIPLEKDFYITSPQSLPKLFSLPPSQIHAWKKSWPTNLAIYSPRTIEDPSKFVMDRDTTTLVLIDPNFSYLYDNGATWKTNKLSEMHLSAGTVTRAQIDSISLDWQQKAIAWIQKYSFLVWPVVIGAQLIGMTFSLLWYSLLLLLIVKVFGYLFTYGKAVKFAAYVLIVSQAISQISSVLNPWGSVDMQSLSFWVITTYLLWALKNHLPKQPAALVT